MKLLFTLVVIGVSTVLGDVAPYPPSGWKPQGALLVLPPTYSPPQNDVPPQPFQDEKENLEVVNQSVMERLRQEEGSDTGIYYVYLPDGRLQRVQYTTAPIKQQDAQPAQQQYPTDYQPQYAPSGEYGPPPPAPPSQNFQPRQSSQYKQNVPAASNRPQGGQQSNFQVVLGANKNSNQGNQQQYNRLNAEQQFGESRQDNNYQQNQRNQFQDGQQRQQTNSDNNTTKSGDPSEILAQFKQQDRSQQNVPATSYLASVQFTDVPPITGPIFAYSPSPLVRIVRYANNFQ